MSDGIYTALSGAIAQQRALDVVANNVANIRTTGFQADRVAFQEVLADTREGDAPNAMSYVTISRVGISDDAGSLKQTGNPLDLALQGEGYFAIQTPRGERYTRGGAFSLDADGVIRTQQGYAVLGGEGSDAPGAGTELIIPRGTAEVAIAPDGSISADGVAVGRLRIVRFEDMRDVTKEGLQLVAPEGVSPVEAPETRVAQGYLESSNVNAVHGLHHLIVTSRSYEAFQRVIKTFADTDRRAARSIAGK